MLAEQTWRVWRRILREPELAHRIMTSSIAECGAEFGLDPAELRVAKEYARHGRGVRWAVEGYRYRLIRVTRDAVAEGAPLTAAYLGRAGCDLNALAAEFVEADGWQDRGPYIYTTTLAYLDHLMWAGNRIAGHPAVLDVIRLERAGADLVIRSATRPVTPASQGDRPVWTARAALVPISHDITAWLTDPLQSDPAAATRRDQSVLVRLDGSPSHYAFSVLGAAAAQVVAALATGATVDDAARMLGVGADDAGLRGLLDTLIGWGVLATQRTEQHTTP